jgi:hypothetical protein
MAVDDLVIFDTSTLPEYYDDVHKILCLPINHVVTYDYSAHHIDQDALTILKELATKGGTRRALLAYMQSKDYNKGDASSETTPLAEDSFVTLTRLAELIAVREVTSNDKTRYYLDLCLLSYPFDRHQSIAKDIVKELRKRESIPMRKFIAVCPDTASNALFTQNGDDDQFFSSVVSELSSSPSQFSRDTFWRISKITYRTKTLLPFLLSKSKELQPLRGNEEDGRTQTYLSVEDQATIYFHIQFHRALEHGSDYRIRKIRIGVSPLADLSASSFPTRSYGREIVAMRVPATMSLSTQEIAYQLETVHHEKDERKDYPYGPTVKIPIRYRKAPFRSILAIGLICCASALFAWAAFATSILTSVPTVGHAVPLSCRAVAVVLGVVASLYAYYLWSDEISLDRARRG